MEKRLNLYHALLHFSYQAFAGIYYGFGVYMLVNRGYSAALAGLLMSLACGFSTLLTPFVSNFLDHSGKVSIFEMVIIESALIVLAFIGNYFMKEESLLLSILFVLGGGFFASVEPMMNTYATIFNANGFSVDYGKARSIGSFGYGLICAVFGLLTARFGYPIAIGAGVVFGLSVMINAFLLRKEYKKTKKKKIAQEKTDTISFIEFIKGNVGFAVLCLCMTGFMLSYTGADNFTLMIVENVGGDSSDMGMILGVKAFLEMAALYFFSRILKKVKLENILILSAVCFFLKMVAIWLAPSVLFIYLAQLFQVGSFAMILPGMVEYVNRHMKANSINRGQSFATMTIGIGSLISGALGGAIIEAYGVYTMGLIFTVISFISVSGFILVLKKIS